MPTKIIKSKPLSKEKKTQKNDRDHTKIQRFEGVEGLKKIYKQTLKDKKPIFALTAVIPDINPDLLKWLEKTYIKKRVENKIFVKAISPKTKNSEKYIKADKKCYRKTLLIPQDKFPITIEINVFGDKVGLISYKKKELIGTIIESKEIAKTMRVFFDLAWERAQEYQKEWKNRF